MGEKRWLTGWKSIALHLDVSIRKAQRMAWNGMPVRYEGGIPVAEPPEIDSWRRDKLRQITPNHAKCDTPLACPPR